MAKKKTRFLLQNRLEAEVWTTGLEAFFTAEDDAICLRAKTLSEFDHRFVDDTAELSIRHPIDTPVHLWIPHLTPAPGNVIAERVLRTPAIVVGGKSIALAFVVDVDDLKEARNTYKPWLDYDARKQTITLAAGNYREEGHVFYVRERNRRAERDDPQLRLHIVQSVRPEDLANPYGLAARYCWTRWGRDEFRKMPPAPYAKFLEHIVRFAFAPEPDGWADSVWQEVSLRGLTRPAGAPVFIVDVHRHPSIPVADRTWREPRAIWNQAWFSTQRCANGLLRYARQIEADDLESRARRMTEVALAAPQTDGLFPAVLIANDDEGWHWSNSDRRPATVTADACHIVDAAFTARMLLEWYDLTKDERALAYVERFAERLLALQRPSGAFPGWVEPSGRVPKELAEGPESAVSVSLLFDLAKVGDPARADERRAAAMRGIAFLEGVAADGRWEDFETYWSCCRWGEDHLGKRVKRNGVYKQNTLSIFWCAEAFLRAGDLALARRCLDELSLYQACWEAPFLFEPNFGGFGVMNADSEWNDARQSLFAPLYLELGERLGDEELIERGVAALRASFTMLYCPENERMTRAYEFKYPFFGPESYGFMMENQAHSGTDLLGTFTIFTWGPGSALAAVATVRDRFPAIAKAHGLA